MSGVEAVAGLVLAILPLCISALEHYKSGRSNMSVMLKWGGHLDELIHRLKTQRMIFRLNAMILLKVAGVDDVTDEGEDSYIALLMEEETTSKFKEYLDFTYPDFKEVVGRYEQCLKTIVAKLVNIKRIPEADKDDLKAVLAANAKQDGGFAFMQRLEFTIERGKLKQLVEALKEENLTLERITRGMRTIHEFDSQPPSGDSVKLARIFNRVQKYANSLHTAIACGWMPGCHPDHEVMILLADRFRRAPHSSKFSDGLVFDVIFASEDQTPAHGRWHAATVYALEDAEQDEQLPPTPYIQVKTAQKHRKAKVKFDVPDTRLFSPLPPKVSNICMTVRNAKAQKQSLFLQLIINALHLPTHFPGTVPLPTAVSGDTISLEYFLQETLHDEDSQLGCKQRTLLALNVASSILQLHSTQWFRVPWTKTHIRFFIKGVSKTDIDADRPLIAHTLPNPQSDPTIAAEIVNPKSSLLELAILLLEIWHHKSLETWAAASSNSYNDTFDGRRSAAIRWLETSQNRLPPNHLLAIEACLRFCAGRLREWHEDDFRKQICEDVIKPLRKNFDAW